WVLFSEDAVCDPCDLGPDGFNGSRDTPHQLGGLAGAGGGFNDQCVVKRCRNLLAIGLIRKRHGCPLSWSRSAICSRDLRRARRSWFGPHTGRKSQNEQALSAGAGGSMPSSTPRSIISNASMPMSRLRSLMATLCSVNPPAVVQYEKRALSTVHPVAASTARL